MYSLCVHVCMVVCVLVFMCIIHIYDVYIIYAYFIISACASQVMTIFMLYTYIHYINIFLIIII